MKTLKTIALVILAILFILPTTVIADDTDFENIYICTYDESDIVINHNGLNEETLMRIAQAIGDPNFENWAQPCGLVCTLFGHDDVHSTTTSVVHKVYETAPRCTRTWYDVYTCDRCGRIETVSTDVKNIYCCE